MSIIVVTYVQLLSCYNSLLNNSDCAIKKNKWPTKHRSKVSGTRSKTQFVFEINLKKQKISVILA